MPDMKLMRYSKSRLNKHYYQHAKLHSGIEKYTNRDWTWSSLLSHAFTGDMTSTTGHTRLHSSIPHQTSISLRPSWPLKLHFTSHNNYDPGKTGTKCALGHVNRVHITNNISHSSTECCITFFKAHILQTNKVLCTKSVRCQLKTTKSQSMSLGLHSTTFRSDCYFTL